MKLIDLSNEIRSPIRRRAYRLVAPPIEAFLAIGKLNKTYKEVSQRDVSRDNFLSEVLKNLNVTYNVSEEDLDRIPEDGPLVTVSNHPFGGLDAIMVADLLLKRRPDSKFLANSLLKRVPEAEPIIIGVDPFGGEDAKVRNYQGMRESIKWLRSGHCLGTFPAGEVAHFKLRERSVIDPPWSPHVAGLIESSRAATLPVFVSGRNSILFQLLGLVHPLLRTLMIPREVMNKTSRSFEIHIGKPIPHGKLAKIDSQEPRMDYLRMCTCILGQRDSGSEIRLVSPQSEPAPVARVDVVAQSSTPAELRDEINALPPGTEIHRKGDFAVYVTKSKFIPRMMEEIGRLREVTFREVGEGSGNAADLEPFDDYYWHLFAWDHNEEALVGAYRMGETQEIVSRHGMEGLYTNTLFRFAPEFIEKLGPSLEMGRSFICSRYQRKHGLLALLWRGILDWIGIHAPHLRMLFGPVSISQEYNALSKNLIVQYLRHHLLQPEMSMFVKPRNPFKAPRMMGLSRKDISQTLRGVEDISALVSEIEEDGKGIPVLLKHYLKLNATLLSFNVDPDFSDVLDGLIVVDMHNIDARMLKLYMGQDARERYCRHNSLPVP
ncbi:MAG: lysophospholipid acyltransferase family protein [Verrucomicrobiota bacterium]